VRELFRDSGRQRENQRQGLRSHGAKYRLAEAFAEAGEEIDASGKA
jgi:hypothetical protein